MIIRVLYGGVYCMLCGNNPCGNNLFSVMVDLVLEAQADLGGLRGWS